MIKHALGTFLGGSIIRDDLDYNSQAKYLEMIPTLGTRHAFDDWIFAPKLTIFSEAWHGQ